MEAAAILKHIPLFSELGNSEIEVVTGASRRKVYPRGNIVFHEGDPGDYLLVILKGRVKVTLLGKDGKETIIRILAPTEFLGEIALLDGAPRSATVITLERTEVLEIARRPFLQIVKTQPAIALKIMIQLAGALRRATEQIRTLSMYDVYGRLLRCLLMMAHQNGESPTSRMVLHPRPKDAELARMIGCQRETVSRAMKTLRATGYVTEVKRGLAIEERAISQYLLTGLQNLAPPADRRDR